MSELINERVSFGHGFVQGRDKVRVIARFDDMAEQGSATSMLMMWAGEGRYSLTETLVVANDDV